MEKRNVAVTVVLLLMMISLLLGPLQLVGASASVATGSGRSVSLTPSPSQKVSAPAISTHAVSPSVVRAPATSYPRTVLIETFTGVWCHYCPAESQALYNLDRNISHNVVDIAELHSCAFATGQGPCLENYVPSDGTTNSRASYYNICGFPDVFFDGLHGVCGAVGTFVQTTAKYERSIANASNTPGNVSIVQSASISNGNVTGHANITSAIDGSYNAITYLLENINKQNVSNGYGPHDIGWAVRVTLVNHPVVLTSGATTVVNFTRTLNTSWISDKK